MVQTAQWMGLDRRRRVRSCSGAARGRPQPPRRMDRGAARRRARRRPCGPSPRPRPGRGHQAGHVPTCCTGRRRTCSTPGAGPGQHRRRGPRHRPRHGAPRPGRVRPERLPIGQNVAWRRWMEIASSSRRIPTSCGSCSTCRLDPRRSSTPPSPVSRHGCRPSATSSPGAPPPSARSRRADPGRRADRAQRAETRLGYRLNRPTPRRSSGATQRNPDRASWSAPRNVDAGGRAHAPLRVVAGAATRWVWIPGKAALDARRLLQRWTMP